MAHSMVNWLCTCMPDMRHVWPVACSCCSTRNQTCGDYIARASKVITLVDLAGHEKYFRTTAYGLTGGLLV